MRRLYWVGLVGLALALGLAACKGREIQADGTPVPQTQGHPVAKKADCLTVPARPGPAPRLVVQRNSPERSDCGLDGAACGAWRRFRQDHPYPYQAFAGQRLPGGKAVLVLSEPPPELSKEAAANLVKTALA